MRIKKQIKVLQELLDATKELNGEYQAGWDETIENGEKLIKHLQHEYDTTRGLWVTDKPEVLTEEQKEYFWQLK